MERSELLKALELTISLMFINIIFGIIWSIVIGSSQVTTVAIGFGFLELALLLILGACLMARDPIDQEDRFDEMGFPNTRYKMVVYGRILIISSILLFLFTSILFVIGILLSF